MDNTYSFVQEAQPMKKIESHGRIVALMAQQTTECAYFIRDYTLNKDFCRSPSIFHDEVSSLPSLPGIRTLRNTFMSDTDSKIKQYEDTFKELSMAFQDRAILQTRIIVSHIMDNLESLGEFFHLEPIYSDGSYDSALDIDLSDMPYAKGARFDPDKGCLPGTRENIIEEISQWINSSNEDVVYRVFFLTGVAGSGKSAIAHTIAQRFDRLRRLGSSYCNDRADQANRHPRNLLSTIALDVADLDCRWKMSLCNVVKGNRSLRTTLAATEQFEQFLLEPANALTTIGPIVIVIDALDESGDEMSRRALLDILSRRTSELPSNFRVLITARPEQDLLNAFNGYGHVLCKYMDSIDERSNEADIALFIEGQLSGINDLEFEWPNKHWSHMLMKSSDGLFQWASTACRAIKDMGGGGCAHQNGLAASYLQHMVWMDYTPQSFIKSLMNKIAL